MLIIIDIICSSSTICYMEDMALFGKMIKEKRLSQNLRMDDVARMAGISRVTLWALEKGEGSCSLAAFSRVVDALGMRLMIEDQRTCTGVRRRASRANTILSKKINRFIVLCIEQYALYSETGSSSVYRQMKSKGVFEDLESDYEDLHGMSNTYLNNYIRARLGGLS